MGKINLLDTEISNKIAAGEVVERPASVVKELVENSIDAGATKITVEIKNGGNTYIKVTDNGHGMERDDASVAFLRHATSKISTEEDLNAIYTLGFRGEALSSIGAVSMVDLYTKRKEDELGTHTTCEGGEIISDTDAGIPDGTTFIVKNLFYNVPARMKFLKKDATEAGYIGDIMTRFILSHPEIAFKFISNSKPVLTSYGDGKLENCIYSVYGKDYASAMIKVDFASEYVKVTGLCGKGSTARPNRTYQSFFINGRYIKSPLIMRAVEEAYKNQIMIGKFPTAVLNLEINPALIDINVHPTKLEVKFSNENEVYQAVYHAVKDALYRIADIPEIKKSEQNKPQQPLAIKPDVVLPNAQIELKTEHNPTEVTPLVKPDFKKSEITATTKPVVEKENSGQPKTIFDKTTTTVNAPKLFEEKMQAFKKFSETQNVLVPEQPKTQAVTIIETQEPAPKEENPVSKNSELEFTLIGQIFDTYIIIQVGEEIRIIDQHAAHERLKYEELLEQMKAKKVYSQGLAIPVVIKLSSVELAAFLQNTEFFASLGFDAEDYGNGSVIVRSVPTSCLDTDVSEIFIEILSQLDDNKKEIITEKKERLLYSIACKAAIKANHKLSEKEQIELVKMVFSLDTINTCPHGRPIVVSMTKKEIEKTFKRIV